MRISRLKSAHLYQRYYLTSAKASQVQKFSLQPPTNVVASGETGIIIPFTALDQNGAAVTDPTELSTMNPSPTGDPNAGGAAGAVGKLYWTTDYVHNVGVLEFDAPTATVDTPVTLMIRCE